MRCVRKFKNLTEVTTEKGTVYIKSEAHNILYIGAYHKLPGEPEEAYTENLDEDIEQIFHSSRCEPGECSTCDEDREEDV